ncbi:MAG: rhodanese-like domain-containing protein [Burkholderiales bacterium]|nr:rhodanese-like domain-containing protein [Burkholderiales bacterium]
MFYQRFLGTIILLCAVSFVSLSLPALGSAPARTEPGRTGNLVSVDWLKRNLARKDLILLDASAPPLYAKGRIPGAVSASILSHGVQEMSPEKMEARYRGYGIRNDSTVVIYEGGDAMWAHHLFYDLYYHGFAPERLLILDGGLEKWKADGGGVTTTPSQAPQPGDFRVAALRESARVRLPEVLLASGDTKKATLVEALGPEWHFGDKGYFDRMGHIPNSVMLPSDDFFNADRTFKSPEELRRMFAYVGVKPGQSVYTHCGGGVAAAVPFFALKFILGEQDVRLFRESQVGWLQDDRSLPFWTYSAPQLLRDTTWARTWGGAMMRMYRNSAIDFIDARPAEEFKFRHARFALSVPAATVRPHLHDPAKLASLFAEAGVNANHEAMVMAGSGITPDAALVYLALEAAGQARVSVLPEGLEQAATKGLAVNDSTKATPAAAPASSAPKRAYQASPRKDVVIRDPAGTRGLYPKVFIVSDAKPLAKTLPGKVVQVPYTELLRPDGTPKAAKDLWQVLSKAGVPRYAELVTVAEDAGAAALNYLVLKLMGFPDVNVLVP